MVTHTKPLKFFPFLDPEISYLKIHFKGSDRMSCIHRLPIFQTFTLGIQHVANMEIKSKFYVKFYLFTEVLSLVLANWGSQIK